MHHASTTPPARSIPRPPNATELEHFKSWIADGRPGPEFFDDPYWLDCLWIAVFDHYCTDSPGYSGKVMYVVWGAAPDSCNVFTWHGEGMVHESTHQDCGTY